FSREIWSRMESPALPVRLLGALQWQHSSQRYTKAITELRQTAPPLLHEATRIPLADSIILGISDVEGIVRVELHSSTRSGMSGRVQLMFHQARLLARPPRGSWILQEEWGYLTSGSRQRSKVSPNAASGKTDSESGGTTYRFT